MHINNCGTRYKGMLQNIYKNTLICLGRCRALSYSGEQYRHDPCSYRVHSSEIRKTVHIKMGKSLGLSTEKNAQPK